MAYCAGASSVKADEYVRRCVLTVISLKIFGVLASNSRSDNDKISVSIASGGDEDGRGRYPVPGRCW